MDRKTVIRDPSIAIVTNYIWQQEAIKFDFTADLTATVQKKS